VSWSVRIANTKVGSVLTDAPNAVKAFTASYGVKEQEDACAAALGAADVLASVVGHEGDEISVSASGHANEGLVKQGGWTSDFFKDSEQEVKVICLERPDVGDAFGLSFCLFPVERKDSPRRSKQPPYNAQCAIAINRHYYDSESVSKTLI
jgi:hypothetical protein